MAEEGRGGSAGAGAARAVKSQGGLSREERELAEMLKGLKMECDRVVESDLGFEAFSEAVWAVIKTWASWNRLEIVEGAELCEPSDVRVEAVGAGFSNWHSFACFAVLEDGRHIHLEIIWGYTGPWRYYEIKEVRLEELEESRARA